MKWWGWLLVIWFGLALLGGGAKGGALTDCQGYLADHRFFVARACRDHPGPACDELRKRGVLR